MEQGRHLLMTSGDNVGVTVCNGGPYRAIGDYTLTIAGESVR
ncbi:MAG: hypothetical protein AAF579_04100 [Cyanobacteria bacterium P01_C01_bin.118]